MPFRTTPLRFGLILLIALSGTGCIYDGLVAADESGFSRGPSRYGALHEGVRLPERGKGYWIPTRWSTRGLNFGVDELVSTLAYVGRSLQSHDSALVLSVGDISPRTGGRSRWHRSHQTGRDVDLLFFLHDSEGKIVVSDTMRRHDSNGAERVEAKEEPMYFFDVPANWLLVATMLDNPISEIQYIFIQDGLRQMLLEYAASSGASESLIARAAFILQQPGDSAPHDDHMHVRIFCPKSDLRPGCQDFGQLRWHKRDYKYERRVERLRRYEDLVPAGTLTALPWLLR